jgi:hypothetical protein
MFYRCDLALLLVPGTLILSLPSVSPPILSGFAGIALAILPILPLLLSNDVPCCCRLRFLWPAHPRMSGIISRIAMTSDLISAMNHEQESG